MMKRNETELVIQGRLSISEMKYYLVEEWFSRAPGLYFEAGQVISYAECHELIYGTVSERVQS
jgi:hypothetical protein